MRIYIISHGKNGYGAYDMFGFMNPLGDNIYEVNNSIRATSYNNIRREVLFQSFDDIVKSKTLVQFVREISGGLLLGKHFCRNFLDINTGNKNCVLLKQKLQSICIDT